MYNDHPRELYGEIKMGSEDLMRIALMWVEDDLWPKEPPFEYDFEPGSTLQIYLYGTDPLPDLEHRIFESLDQLKVDFISGGDDPEKVISKFEYDYPFLHMKTDPVEPARELRITNNQMKEFILEIQYLFYEQHPREFYGYLKWSAGLKPGEINLGKICLTFENME